MLNDDMILSHHGIKGQRWGIRRFQNEDGTRTVAGKARYNSSADDRHAQKLESLAKKANEKSSKAIDKLYAPKKKKLDSLYEKAAKEDPELDYDKSAWKKINKIETDLGVKESKIRNRYDDKVIKQAQKYVDSYFKKNNEISYNDVFKKFDYAETYVESVLGTRNIEIREDGIYFKK